ncbi:nucleoside deaminase [Gilvimarinus sp. SDUM040013]|uniref:Nucleoside deaminase n=1 Tax=Gilvimarinus gilvus TaxID=3058038 RepID=A0ABU4RXH3_9GAMM|nr:nucleoside deaminase [Gilvimarinus sp. SDUM040013]MDO3388705.1 nucleoside deaminase [Gilvimarinus sp. SDUM040013]MDX6849600.1 nucleoside deaminase [Gilvimarinus sp. SDUM040013]
MIDQTSALHTQMLQHCLDLAKQSVSSGGGPFAAIVVKNNDIIAKASNRVTKDCDPTSHAEVNAIRRACAALKSHQLIDCVVYSSCEPCPMCLGALFWARPLAVYFAASRRQAAAAGFDDSLIYQQIGIDGAERKIPFHHLAMADANSPFQQWQLNHNRVKY